MNLSWTEAEAWHVKLYTREDFRGWCYREFIAALWQRVGQTLDGAERSIIALDMMLDAERVWGAMPEISPAFSGFLAIVTQMGPPIVKEDNLIGYRWLCQPQRSATLIKWLLRHELGGDDLSNIDLNLYAPGRKQSILQALFLHENALPVALNKIIKANTGIIGGTTSVYQGRYIRVTNWTAEKSLTLKVNA